MVGGGPGAFIGAVHRMATALDGRYELVAGAFSSSPGRSREFGRELGLDPSRSYGHFDELAGRERELDGDRRIQVAAVVTPNHLHAPATSALLDAGIPVVCDKPFTTRLRDAEQLCRKLASTTPPLGCVTYNYSGYPMVKEARAIVRAGGIGEVRRVFVEYVQGWLSSLLEAPARSGDAGHKQAAWRSDPECAGPSPVLGDIGTHAHHLLRYVTGLEPARLHARLRALVPGRKVHDDAVVSLELEGGANAVLQATQLATGERNHLRIRVYGSEGGLDWRQESPEVLRLLRPDGSERILRRGAGATSAAAGFATRLPAGHPEGFVEALANVYSAFAAQLTAYPDQRSDYDHPTFQDGASGVHFVERAVASDRAGEWVDARYSPPGVARPIPLPE